MADEQPSDTSAAAPVSANAEAIPVEDVAGDNVEPNSPQDGVDADSKAIPAANVDSEAPVAEQVDAVADVGAVDAEKDAGDQVGVAEGNTDGAHVVDDEAAAGEGGGDGEGEDEQEGPQDPVVAKHGSEESAGDKITPNPGMPTSPKSGEESEELVDSDDDDDDLAAAEAVAKAIQKQKSEADRTPTTDTSTTDTHDKDTEAQHTQHTNHTNTNDMEEESSSDELESEDDYLAAEAVAFGANIGLLERMAEEEKKKETMALMKKAEEERKRLIDERKAINASQDKRLGANNQVKKRHVVPLALCFMAGLVLLMYLLLPANDNKRVATWGPEQVAEWADGLEDLSDVPLKTMILNQKIDGPSLCVLKDESVKSDLGLDTFGLRRKFLKSQRIVCTPSPFSWDWFGAYFWKGVVPVVSLVTAMVARTAVNGCAKLRPTVLSEPKTD